MADVEYAIRPGIAEDQAYLTATWWNSLRRAGHKADPGPDIDALLDRTDVRVLVATETTYQPRILGWLVYTPMPPSTIALHYVYVREPQRQAGIAREMFRRAREGLTADPMVLYTFTGPAASVLLAKHEAVHVPVRRFL